MNPCQPIPLPLPTPTPPSPVPPRPIVYVAVRILAGGSEILGVYASATGAATKANADGCEVVALPLEP